MTTRVKGFGEEIEDMVITDTSKDKEPKVITTCDDCQYNAYRMLGEEAKKLNEPDNCGESYNPFSQNGKVVQIATYIQTAYRDGYKHGYKDGYKQGYEQHGKDFILDGERIREDALKEAESITIMTEEYAINYLKNTGWLERNNKIVKQIGQKEAWEVAKKYDDLAWQDADDILLSHHIDVPFDMPVEEAMKLMAEWEERKKADKTADDGMIAHDIQKLADQWDCSLERIADVLGQMGVKQMEES